MIMSNCHNMLQWVTLLADLLLFMFLQITHYSDIFFNTGGNWSLVLVVALRSFVCSLELF